MNLEQIDTSTTAGKAEVMRLAAEGRRVVACWKASGEFQLSPWIEVTESAAKWNWSTSNYAIIRADLAGEAK